MSPLAKLARLRRLLRADREDALLVLDWDDTLLPNTHLVNEHGARTSTWNKDELLHAEQLVRALLERAEKLGRVVILTNARRPWIKHSCQSAFPNLLKQVLRIEHVYAEDFAPQVPQDVVGLPRLAALKKLALEKLLKYQPYRQLVSVGDGEPELLAAQAVAAQRPALRVKAIKLAAEPTLGVLCAQLAALAENLGVLVQHKEGCVCDGAGKPLVQHKGDSVAGNMLVPGCGVHCVGPVPYPLTKEAVAFKAVL